MSGQTGVRKDSATNLARAFSCSTGQIICGSADGEMPEMRYESLQVIRKTYEKLHLRNLLIHLFHELYDEINQLMLQHFLGMKIGYQE